MSALVPTILCLTCGEPLTLECEKDTETCVDCAADAAGMPLGREVEPAIDRILQTHFPRHFHQPMRSA